MSWLNNCCCCECPPGKTVFECCPCCYVTLTKNGVTFNKATTGCSWTDDGGNELKFCYGQGWTLNGAPTNGSGSCPPDGFTYCYTPPDLKLTYSITGNFRSADIEGPDDAPKVVCEFGVVNLQGTLIIKGAPCGPGTIGSSGWLSASTGPIVVASQRCSATCGFVMTCDCENCPGATCAPSTMPFEVDAYVSFTQCDCANQNNPPQFLVTVSACDEVQFSGTTSCENFNGNSQPPDTWNMQTLSKGCFNCENPTVTLSLSLA